jgi:Family of unknown function (DUF5317)
VILLLALGGGLLAGLGWAKWRGHPYQPPRLNYLWLAILAFLPQFFTIYFERTQALAPDWLAALAVVLSQGLLFIFAWLNRHVPGMLVLIFGLILNITVIIANGGFMPINPQTVEHIVGKEKIATFELGNRIGYKDILLPKDETRLELLADRFLPPSGFHYQVAFSLGDIFIAIGAFWILAYQKSTT